MLKSNPNTDLTGYAPVAERLRLFWNRFPAGRIDTRLESRDNGEVVFFAAVCRDIGDAVPAATGWASEKESDGDINAVACLENTETSAIGRALANLGFTAAAQRPSAEEMAKASRARVRLAARAAAAATVATTKASPKAPPAPTAAHVTGARGERMSPVAFDVVRLIARAEGLGAVRSRRAARWRAVIPKLDDRSLVRLERRLPARCNRIDA